MSRRNNSRRHSVYQVEKAGSGASTLDRRTKAARAIAHTKAAIASDRGFGSWDQVPRLLQALIERAAYKDYQCRLIENLDPDALTPTLKADYFKWAESLRRVALDIGLTRLARTVNELDLVRRQIETEGEE